MLLFSFRFSHTRTHTRERKSNFDLFSVCLFLTLIEFIFQFVLKLSINQTNDNVWWNCAHNNNNWNLFLLRSLILVPMNFDLRWIKKYPRTYKKRHKINPLWSANKYDRLFELFMFCSCLCVIPLKNNLPSICVSHNKKKENVCPPSHNWVRDFNINLMTIYRYTHSLPQSVECWNCADVTFVCVHQIFEICLRPFNRWSVMHCHCE